MAASLGSSRASGPHQAECWSRVHRMFTGATVTMDRLPPRQQPPHRTQWRSKFLAHTHRITTANSKGRQQRTHGPGKEYPSWPCDAGQDHTRRHRRKRSDQVPERQVDCHRRGLQKWRFKNDQVGFSLALSFSAFALTSSKDDCDQIEKLCFREDHSSHQERIMCLKPLHGCPSNFTYLPDSGRFSARKR